MKNFVKYIHQKFDKFVLLVGLLGHGFRLIISTLINIGSSKTGTTNQLVFSQVTKRSIELAQI